MRFDFKKERYGPGYYSHMPKEQLSYHIANKKRIYIVGNEIKRSIEGAPASIVIDEFGKFSVESYFPKSGKIKITKERLESIILEIIDSSRSFVMFIFPLFGK